MERLVLSFDGQLYFLATSLVGIQHNQWFAFFLKFLVDMFHNVQLPQCYLLCLAKVPCSLYMHVVSL